jgi:hypothetical protein
MRAHRQSFDGANTLMIDILNKNKSCKKVESQRRYLYQNSACVKSIVTGVLNMFLNIIHIHLDTDVWGNILILKHELDIYGGTKVTCVCFLFISWLRDTMSWPEVLSRVHEIAKSWPRDTMSWPRVTKSWPRDS